MYNIESLVKLQEWFARMPGIGRKSAMRLAYHVIKMPEEDVREFAKDMYQARLKVKPCPICGNLTDKEICPICEDIERDRSVICVVRDARDVLALERMKDYRGLYHVLGGTIAPLEGVGPEDIAIAPLIKRVKDGDIREVILATNPDVTGEATAAYIAGLLKPLGIRLTRIAHGVPVGGELEYSDDMTLFEALSGRREYER